MYVCMYVCMSTTFLPFSEIKCECFLSITFGNVTLLHDGSYSGFLNCTNGHDSMVMIAWSARCFIFFLNGIGIFKILFYKRKIQAWKSLGICSTVLARNTLCNEASDIKNEYLSLITNREYFK